MSDRDEDEVKARRRAQRVALFGYQSICPALDPGLSTRARGRIVRGIAAGMHERSTAGPVRYSRDSLDWWIRRYRTDGSDALLPSAKRPGPRTEPEVLDLAAALKAENPARTAAQVARILIASTGWSPSE